MIFNRYRIRIIHCSSGVGCGIHGTCPYFRISWIEIQRSKVHFSWSIMKQSIFTLFMIHNEAKYIHHSWSILTEFSSNSTESQMSSLHTIRMSVPMDLTSIKKVQSIDMPILSFWIFHSHGRLSTMYTVSWNLEAELSLSHLVLNKFRGRNDGYLSMDSEVSSTSHFNFSFQFSFPFSFQFLISISHFNS